MGAAIKAEKVQLRLEKRQKALIVEAARSQEKTLTQFMVENACAAARQALAEQVHLKVSPERWEAFVAALDRPAKSNPKLAKLMQSPGIFDVKRK